MNKNESPSWIFNDNGVKMRLENPVHDDCHCEVPPLHLRCKPLRSTRPGTPNAGEVPIRNQWEWQVYLTENLSYHNLCYNHHLHHMFYQCFYVILYLPLIPSISPSISPCLLPSARGPLAKYSISGGTLELSISFSGSCHLRRGVVRMPRNLRKNM